MATLAAMLCLIPAIHSNLFAQACTPPRSGITNWWPFDGPGPGSAQTPDIAGGQNASFNSGGTLDFPVGFVGKSTCGSGAPALWTVHNPDTLNLLRGDFTFEFWTSFNAAALHGTNFLQAQGWQVYGVSQFIVGFEPTSISGTTANGHLVVGVVRPEAIGGELRFVNTPFFPSSGQWYHIAVTRSGDVYTIYVNGTPLASGTSSIDPGPPDPTLGTLSLIATGCIDEATLYARALTLTELHAIVGAGGAGKCKQLTISTSSIPDLSLASVADFQLSAILNSGPVTWTISSGLLPPGVQLDSSGKLSGQPLHAGTYSFTARATDTTPTAAQKTFGLEVLLAPPPAQIQVHKTGTAVIPGRTTDYFILVENRGASKSDPVLVQEVLDDSAVSLISALPAPISDLSTMQAAGLIVWNVPSLMPGETSILRYSVKIKSTVPLGSTVIGGPVCSMTGSQEDQFSTCMRKRIAGALQCTVCGPVCAAAETPITLLACLACAANCVDKYYDYKRMCSNPPPPPAPSANRCFEYPQPVVGAVDPNEKLVTPAPFILPDQTLTYPIHFDNVGTAEARDVFVSDTLDSNLDLSTLKIMPSDQATIDLGTRTISWSLLGRHLQPGDGDAVMLSIQPKPALPSGTVIRNTGTIQFDSFQPMNTNQTASTIDSTKPSCHMNPLPMRTTNTNIPLSWTGTDAIGVISSYSVWVSTNNGVFTPVVLGTTSTSTTFGAPAGNGYGFLCVATDVAGNVETKPDVAEVSTTVGTSIAGDVNGDGIVDCQDISIVRAAFGTHEGDAKFDARADVVADGVIDIRDLAFVSQKLPAGTRCQ